MNRRRCGERRGYHGDMSPRLLALVLLTACSAGPAAAPTVKTEQPADAPVKADKAPEPVEPPVKAAEPTPVPATPAPAVPPSQELEVEARLVERPGAVACGALHAVVVMRYEVVRVVAGDYPHRELLVAHSCPEMGSTQCKELPGERIERFQVGDTHHLRGSQKRGSGALIDKFADRYLPRYRASCANLVTPAS